MRDFTIPSEYRGIACQEPVCPRVIGPNQEWNVDFVEAEDGDIFCLDHGQERYGDVFDVAA